MNCTNPTVSWQQSSLNELGFFWGAPNKIGVQFKKIVLARSVRRRHPHGAIRQKFAAFASE